MIIRICTEDTNTEALEALIARHFDCFALYHPVGYWKGTREQALTIEIAVLPGDSELIACATARQLAQAIKTLNAQEAVLIEYLDANNELV